ncbi:MAG TPA: phage tail sheath subtilisin-like domain-containing protein [Pyrinomonadaceae bacterium]|nr:phage tail sheath subtilisin-like domain-containing protein [Pyrinomonadaceae bacterium]
MSLTVENSAPGVTAIVNAGQVSRPLKRQPTSTAFIIGFAPWGPIGVPTVITSWSEFKRKFGGFHSLGWLADAAKIFFDYFGGRQIIAIRAGGASPVKGTITLTNRATTPLATFKFDAKYPSKTVALNIVVTDVAGSTDLCDIKITAAALGVVETYKSADLRSASDLAAINEKSKLVTVSLVATAVSGATGRPQPAVGDGVAFDDGDDGSATVVATDLGAYLTLLNDENLGTGQVLIPGYSKQNQAALMAHAEAYNRLALVEDAIATDYSDAANNLVASPSSYGAAYWPWVLMPAIDGTSGTKLYPPSIFAAGACAQVDRTVGTHKAPANIKVPAAVDVERNVDGTSMVNDNVRAYLNQRNVNVITPIAGEGIKLYGGRVLAEVGETRVQFVHERRMLNLIYYTAKQGYRWAVFAVVDGAGRLFRDLRTSGENFLRSLWRDGGLYGKTEGEAFLVVADETNNPAEELELGRVHVQLGVKLSPTAEQIFVNIDSVPLSQDLNILTGGDN